MKISISIIFIFLIFCCNNSDDYIPIVAVNESIALNLPQHSEILNPGASIFVSGGVKGLIIYHGFGNNYKVYDRVCTYLPQLDCSIIDSINSGIAYCGCCSSAFNISNNAEPLNQPAIRELISYNWSLDNNNVLKIFN